MTALDPRRLATIAASELSRGASFFDRSTTIALVVTTALLAIVGPVALQGGMDFDHGLYRVHVDEGSPVAPVVEAAPRFRRVTVDDPVEAVRDGRIELAVVGGEVLSRSDDKSRAAVQALQEAVRDYNEANLRDEPDRAAAFPVRVDVVYVDRGTIDVPRLEPGTGGGGGGTGGGTGNASDGGGGNGTGGDGGGGDGGNGSVGGGGGDGDAGSTSPGTGLGGFSLVPQDQVSSTPSALRPPFPFQSLILAYVFLIPMNFVVQVYAGRVMAERLDRRGEPLLASPATPREIIVGRTLPYLGLMLATTVAIALWLGGGWLSVVAVMPLVLAFLAFEFVAAMFARSFRELTFLTVFISVVLTIYAFLPAVFTDVTPVAFISPITLVVMDLRGSAVTLVQGLYATLPMTLTAGVLFVLGASLYREEDLFHQKRVPAKLVDALARQVHGLFSGAKLSVMLIPLVLIVELLVVTFLFAWPVEVGLVVGLVGVALVEEAFKALPSWAGLSRGRIDPKHALAFGALTGLGFFVAEKGFLLASLVGLFDVASGAAVFGSAGRTAGLDVWTTLALLSAPLALHVTTAAASAWGARRGRATFVLAVGLAVVVHTVYNVAAIAVGGGLP